MSRPTAALRLFLLLAVLAWAPSLLAQGVVLTTQEQGIADKLVNASGQNRPFLKLDPILTKVARARAADMADRGYFAHVNPDGEGPNYLIEKAGYRLPDAWGDAKDGNFVESIAAGRPTASSTWDDWMNSAPHKKHLLAEDSFYESETSYGVAVATGGEYGYYWVVLTAPPQPAPNLTILSPADGLRVTNPAVALVGKAGDSPKPASIVYRVENSNGNSAFLPLVGTSTWSGTATGLIPGPNVLRFRSLSASGSTLAEGTRTVVYTVFKPLTVSVSGEGTISSGFLGTTDRQLAKKYTITATPSAGSLFVGWTGSIKSSTPTVNFVMMEGMSLQANFVPNPFLENSGSFTGLVTGATSGVAKVKVGKSGGFTGTLRYAGKTYPLKGKLTAEGTATLTIRRPGTTPLVLNLSLDVVNGSALRIAITDGTQSSSVVAAANFQPAADSFAAAGRYTVSLPPVDTSAAPQGSGWATLLVSAKGAIKLSGALATGTPITATGTFAENGTLALYIPLYKGTGDLSGLISTQANGDSDLPGTLRWSKPASPAAGGISTNLKVLASLYTAPVSGGMVLALATGENNAAVVLQGGDLNDSLVLPVTIDTTNRVAASASVLENAKLTINPKNGCFSGSFSHPETGKKSVLRGVVLQKQNAGYGFFQGTVESGSVVLTPAN